MEYTAETSLLLFIGPFILVWQSQRVRKGHERSVREFYTALRKKYVHSYVRQNRLIKFIRKPFGMKTDGTIHWLTAFSHYLQIMMLFGPVLLLILPLFLPAKITFGICGAITMGPLCLIGLITIPFDILQLCRCKKIKKTNPVYSKCKLHRG